jgi:hypothetical protein
VGSTAEFEITATGVTGVTVTGGFNLAIGQQGNATVTLTGCFTQQDSVTLASSGTGAVAIGTATLVSWDSTGGTFTVPITGQTLGAFTLTAADTQSGTPSAVATNNAVIGNVINSISIADANDDGNDVLTTVNGATTFTVTITGTLGQAQAVSITESLNLFGGSIAMIGDSANSWQSNGGPYSTEVLTYQAIGQTAGTETIAATATDSTGTSYPASITADVVQVQSITVADGAGVPVTETGMSSDVLNYTRNQDGTASVNLSSVVVPATVTGFAATQYRVVDGNGTIVASGELSPNVLNIKLPSPAVVTSDAFSLQAGTYLDNSFMPSQSINLAALPTLYDGTVTQPETGITKTAIPAAPADIYIPETTFPTVTSPGSANVVLSADYSEPNAYAGAMARYEVDAAGGDLVARGTFATGNSTPAITLSPSGANMDFTATFWVDRYSDGQVDSSDSSVTISIHLYTVHVQFYYNGTPESEEDAAVMLSNPSDGSLMLGGGPTTLDGTVQLVGDPLPADLPVVLGNPDGRFGFSDGTTAPATGPATTQSTKSITLPAGGMPMPFTLTGLHVSQAVGDGVVIVTGGIGGAAAGVTLGKGKATVFWFTGSSMTVTTDGSYALEDNGPSRKLTVNRTVDDAADIVRLSAKAAIAPAGLDPASPQIKDLRVGIVQDATSSSRVVRYSHPRASTFPLGPGGDVDVPSTKTLYSSAINAGPLVDNTSSDGGGLYSTPESEGPPSPENDRMSKNSTAFPAPGTGGEATSMDNPAQSARSAMFVNVHNAAGQLLGTAIYGPPPEIHIDDTFVDYCVIAVQSEANPSKYVVIAALKETGWTVDVLSSKLALNAKAKPNADAGAGGSAPLVTPQLDGTTFNSALNEPANDQIVDSTQTTTLHFG